MATKLSFLFLLLLISFFSFFLVGAFIEMFREENERTYRTYVCTLMIRTRLTGINVCKLFFVSFLSYYSISIVLLLFECLQLMITNGRQQQRMSEHIYTFVEPTKGTFIVYNK